MTKLKGFFQKLNMTYLHTFDKIKVFFDKNKHVFYLNFFLFKIVFFWDLTKTKNFLQFVSISKKIEVSTFDKKKVLFTKL